MSKAKTAGPVASNRPDLTVREAEVAIGIASGQTYAEIALNLQIGIETARSHVNRLRFKTGRRRKTQLALWAAESMVWLKQRLTKRKKAVA